jgi:rod shape-determining protein MreD
MTLDALKAAVLLFLVVVVQVSIVSAYHPLGGSADLVLVTLLALALLRGSIFGAIAGFAAGFLLDSAHLSTLGVTSLLLTVGGFLIGRYGETTARDRFHAPFTSVGVVTILYAFGTLALRFVLGDPAPLSRAITELPAVFVWNLVLTMPVYAVCRWLFPPIDPGHRIHDVRLIGVSQTAPSGGGS